MTTNPAFDGGIPAWTLGDRLRKGRESVGLNQSEMAEQIGISRGSVLGYESDRRIPGRPVLVSWALRTGVPLWWLQGAACACGEPNTHSDGACSPMDPMQRRRVYNVAPSRAAA